ncbi:methyl-accepting chemotaxis protein [Couchioplanes caeruleus]|uniref:methyl-accepting chemotaxis protein n=1 Tax=Couchioplanes caeruleus TaxID=56438 RepID=UPI0023DF3341|nr:methyl-accepting chemotaxis protein [Couchioplanes caeruleus]
MRLFAGGGGTTAVVDGGVAPYRIAVQAMIEVLVRLRDGDFEARLPQFDGPDELRVLQDVFNDVVDVNDAFVREAAASLGAASRGEYHRQFLTRGLHGAHRVAAENINGARDHMHRTADSVARSEAERATLAERVQQVAEQVAAASTELGATSDALAVSARHAVDRTDGAVATMKTLDEASQQISDAVTLIKRIAAQTRLLALNATIEAARAAEAGRGFAVVASEVKTLADEVNRSSDNIAAQIDDAQRAAGQARAAIHDIAVVIAEMDHQVAGVAAAAGSGLDGQQGLSHLAEALRAEIERLVAD